MSEKIRVCLIGCGRAGMIHAKSYAGLVNGAELVAVCDPDERNIEAVRKIANVRYVYAVGNNFRSLENALPGGLCGGSAGICRLYLERYRAFGHRI